MTQPPQRVGVYPPGPPGHAQQPQVHPRPAPPTYRKQPLFTVVTLLHWGFLAGTFALADLAILSVAMTGDQVFTGLALAIIWGTLGLLNVPAVLTLPSTSLSRLASLVTALAFGGALVRSAALGSAGPIEWTVMVAMLLVCLANVLFTIRTRR